MGARLTLGYDGPATGKWNDSAAVTSWIDVGVKRVQGVFADGLNLDVEILQSDKKQIASLTTAVKQMVDTMHQVVPGSHISVDVPSEGETGSIQATCGDMYGRDYNYKVHGAIQDTTHGSRNIATTTSIANTGADRSGSGCSARNAATLRRPTGFFRRRDSEQGWRQPNLAALFAAASARVSGCCVVRIYIFT